jgi:predicted anti-sigma-YlaC factor YlaD
MHGSVREELENLLAAKPSAGARNISDHVSNCNECASEIDAMRLQAEMLKTLRVPVEIEPGPGFYARVLQRIEEGARRSIWWVFVYSPLGKRLAYASLALSVVLGSYVIAAESNDGHLTDSAYTSKPVRGGHADPIVIGSAEQQRTAVLANFVSHSTPQEISTLQ